MKKVYIKTLGCDKNTVDSECALQIFFNSDCVKTDDPTEADFLLVVTCGFILDAKEQSIESIFDLIRIKTENQILIVSGCLSQRYAEELAAELPEVDYFLGIDDYKKIEDIVNGIITPQSYVGRARKEYCELPRHIENHYSAFLKIAEGCNNVCSYCAIPFMRGRYRSRKPEAVLQETRALAAAGVKEINIIAQDVTFYGNDININNGLPALLKEICRIEGIEWVRLLYCYEDEITDALIECIKTEPKICKYIDIPIQHCSNKILSAMNRKSTKESIKATISKLRNEIPDIIIRTTLIVGFPGELKEDFDELYEFVRETEFDRLGCFTYSKEEGTKAALMKPQIRKDVKERRMDRIMELQRSISLKHNLALIGRKIKVLVIDEEEPGLYIGRSYMDAPDIDNEIMFKGPKSLKSGDFVSVTINDAFDYDLVGETEFFNE